jgi:hypothetical protein
VGVSFNYTAMGMRGAGSRLCWLPSLSLVLSVSRRTSTGCIRCAKQPHVLMAGAQTLALLHLSPSGGSGDDPSPTKVAQDAASAYAAGVQALLAHEAALQRGTATVRCIKITTVFWLSSAWDAM